MVEIRKVFQLFVGAMPSRPFYFPDANRFRRPDMTPMYSSSRQHMLPGRQHRGAGKNHREAVGEIPSAFREGSESQLVGTGRFELPTPRTPSECSTRLSHVPTGFAPLPSAAHGVTCENFTTCSAVPPCTLASRYWCRFMDAKRHQYQPVGCSLPIIPTERFLRSEGSGRAARRVAGVATQPTHIERASLLNA
jgi:hypothetical protein